MNTTNKLYDNCSVYSPCGKLMFRCKEKRINWYLKRNLAKLVDIEGEDGICAQLLFEPKGLGKHNDAFSLEKQENRCVCCGTDEDLTRHHVVPSMYRRHFPDKYKSNYHHDVLPICRTCHDEYELTADELKKKLNDKYQTVDYNEYFAISRIAFDYINYKDVMGDKKLIESILRMNEFVGGNCLDHIGTLVNLREIAVGEIRKQGKIVIDNFDLQEFVEMWRNHFIDQMNPKFLSKHWDVKRSLEKN